MAIKSLIFDAGRVLFIHDFQKLKSHILKKHNFSILLYSDHPKKIQDKYRGLQIGKTSFKKVLKGLSGQKDITKILRDYEKGYKKHQWVNSKLLTFLKKIKKRYQLFCLTNTNDLHFELNAKQGLFKDFTKVYASSKLKVIKPDKRAFLVVLKDNNLNPEEALFIDDGQENLNVAKKLGMKTLIFKNNKQFFNGLKKFNIK